jgi:hypothetical protein
MQFPGKTHTPFRLKLLLALLAAAGAGILLSYAGFKNSVGPYSEDEAGKLLLAKLDIAAAVLNSEIGADLDKARLLAARPALRELLARGARNSGQAEGGELLKSLAQAAGAAEGITILDLADARGRMAASLEARGPGTDLSRRMDFRMGLKGQYVSAPRPDKNSFSYEITVPVPEAGGRARPVGALRCRFKAGPALRAALEALRAGGASLALAKRGGRKIYFFGEAGQGRELSLKAGEAAPFLPALEGREGTYVSHETENMGTTYASRTLTVPDWTLALKTPFQPLARPEAGLLARARVLAALSFALLAAAAFFVASFLTGPLHDTAREAALLLEECGRPAEHPDALSEPSVLAGALSEAASAMKQQAYRDAELETETEKLREEEADLKTQNDELEKPNKYLMEREIKISELKKEISELREKVGSAAE